MRGPLTPSLALALGLVLGPHGAAAQACSPRDDAVVSFDERGAARLDAALADFVLGDPERVARFSSGERQSVVLTVRAVEDGSGVVHARAVRRCTVTFDRWARLFEVEMAGAGIDSVEIVHVPDLATAVPRCLDLSRFPLAEPGALDAPFHVEGTLETNPPDVVTMHQLRRWLENPDGASAGDALRGLSFGFVIAQLVNRSLLGLSADDDTAYARATFCSPSASPP